MFSLVGFLGKPKLRPCGALVFQNIVMLILLTDCHKGESQRLGSSQTVVAFVGNDVILPCYLEPAENAILKTVEWARQDLEPRFVHVWHNGQNLLDNQNPSYKGRTSVSTQKLSRGDLSLTLSAVKHSDNGKYRCYFSSQDTELFFSVELVVGSVSPPLISRVSKDTSGVVLQCESKGWFPEPEVVWLNKQGKVLSAEPKETTKGDDDLFTVQSRLYLKESDDEIFTCRVYQDKINRTRETHVQISADLLEVYSSVAASVTITVFVMLGVFAAAGLIFWKWRQNQTKDAPHQDGAENGDGSSLIQAEEKIKDLVEKNRKLEKEMEGFREKKKTQDKEMMDFQVEKRTLEREMKDFKEEKIILQREKTYFQEEKRRQDEMIMNVQVDQRTLEREMKDFEKEKGNLERKMKDFEKEKENLERKMKDFEKEKENLERKMKDFEKEKGNLERKMKDFEKEKGNLERKMKDFEKEKGNLERKMKDFEKEKRNLEREMKDFEEEKGNLEMRRKDFQDQKKTVGEQDELFGESRNTERGQGGLFGESRNTESGQGGLFGESRNTESGQGGLFGESQNTERGQGGLFGESRNTERGQGGLFGESRNTERGQGGLFGERQNTEGGQVRLFGESRNTERGQGGLSGERTRPKPTSRYYRQ